VTHKLKVLWEPNAGPQTAFLQSTARECLYGGAAGGGKTDALMLLPFYRKDNGKHRSIMFRRTRPQLQEVIDRQQAIYPLVEPGIRWQEEKSRWIWPSGAITQMGFMEHEQDRLKFKTFEYDMVLFDELTSFSEKMYLFLFSRNRTKDLSLPPIMRGGTNPGDLGHQWVFDRFISNREPYLVYEEAIDARDVKGIDGLEGLSTTLQFIPAKLADNPKMPDRQSYVAGLKIMGEEGEAYLAGDWNTFSGQMFRTPLKTGPALVWTPGSLIVRAFDYGWADPMVIMWLRVHPDNTHEVLYEVYSPELTVDSIARICNTTEQSLQVRPVLSVGGHDMFNSEGTSGGESIANMLIKRGIWLEKANNDRVTGWAKVQELLTAGKLYCRQGMAPNLYRTLPNLVRDPNKPQDLKGKQEDHAAECLRYAVMAVPERGLAQVPGYVVTPPPVTERDPVFARLIKELQNGRQDVIFPGLED
jgi:hypothetical protein